MTATVLCFGDFLVVFGQFRFRAITLIGDIHPPGLILGDVVPGDVPDFLWVSLFQPSLNLSCTTAGLSSSCLTGVLEQADGLAGGGGEDGEIGFPGENLGTLDSGDWPGFLDKI